MGEQLSISQGLTCGPTDRTLARRKPFDFVQEALFHLQAVTGVDSRIEHISFHSKTQEGEGHVGVLDETRAIGGERPSGTNGDFQCSHDSSFVVGFDS